MAVLPRLIADIWADPYCHVEGRCEDHPTGSVDCLICQIRVVARWDLKLSKRLWCLYLDYNSKNLLLLRTHLQVKGLEHHWREVVAAVRQAITDQTPFDPDLPQQEA